MKRGDDAALSASIRLSLKVFKCHHFVHAWFLCYINTTSVTTHKTAALHLNTFQLLNKTAQWTWIGDCHKVQFNFQSSHCMCHEINHRQEIVFDGTMAPMSQLTSYNNCTASFKCLQIYTLHTVCLSFMTDMLISICEGPTTLWVNKKQDTKLLPITSPNINRFSKFFHCQTQ